MSRKKVFEESLILDFDLRMMLRLDSVSPAPLTRLPFPFDCSRAPQALIKANSRLSPHLISPHFTSTPVSSSPT
ncbi:hypothetical protein E2C01_013961 [Portunus trituberculatus]|uniref:Uncharacterized protein n=1 Tax=Portunus trituberculatus TaxID=210409 RepID=A0A5B7DHZ4_PORTR|nr:hypothetical protein [Portunus trituberculatus]